MMHPYLTIARRAALRAGQIIMRAYDRVDRIQFEQKGRNDFVSEVDRSAERAIVEIIHKSYPGHAILGEEYGAQDPVGDAATNNSEHRWIIDPLDGTTNFRHNIPHFSISIAYQFRDQLECALILDPVRNEEFCASRGHGAQLNGKRIRVTKTASLENAMIGTGIPSRNVSKDLDAYMEMLKAFTAESRGIRRAGSAALDLAYVAAGRFDGFWELGLSPWDIAAGALLVSEAGGFITDLRSGRKFLDNGNVLAATPRVHKEMLTRLRPHLQPGIL